MALFLAIRLGLSLILSVFCLGYLVAYYGYSGHQLPQDSKLVMGQWRC